MQRPRAALRHKSHFGRTRAAVDKALKAVEDILCIATIKNSERWMEANHVYNA